MQIHVKFLLLTIGPNVNDTQWIDKDSFPLLCLPGLGTGINAAVILKAAFMATLFLFFCFLGGGGVNLIRQIRSVLHRPMIIA